MTYTWIELRLRELKKKKKELGVALSLPPSRISDIINGNRRIQSKEISRLSSFLKMDTTTILKNLQKQSVDTGIKPASKTEQITVIGNKDKVGNKYDIWPVDQHYIITLPRHSSYGSFKKFALEENCAQSNSLKLYICTQEKPKEKIRKRDLLKRKASPSSSDQNRNSKSANLENDLAFVISYYEQI
ncbi:MAG: helix-turn-helix domain-containing protein [Sneathiella sp.]|nr:helix-turn-helix domain-containing protein [Sneathiella sp.]